MTHDLPQKTRDYINHHLDSTRWDAIAPRDGDIVISTPYKCGTTWMQTIVLHLIFQDLEPRVLSDYSPWVEFRGNPLEEVAEVLDRQENRRCIKSHVPVEAIPFREASRYIIVGRDVRDVFMSLWNHYRRYTDAAYGEINDGAEALGGVCPRCPDDVRTFWSWWIGRGWFDWEQEGYPFWGNMGHVRSWWDWRHLPNVLFVHYNDLLADLEGEIGRIAAWLEIPLEADMRAAIAGKTAFASMKADAEKMLPSYAEVFEGGAKGFLNKGTNGRWREVLTAEDVATYERVAERVLGAECRRWLEEGGVV